ncbi:class I SAM-dependent methyltransferase [Actinomadura sp. DC4]|uniref:O-methyltransferase n=1 Tax=Actinomadura sp. DC4 TaxID=3055069 RepID=UPI0025B17554|nr:class I SAM-dependent methyltransferase [Actinomadura sp. DC4]MDN3354457.1 class I SAM-dependent methyltransferase [Actinomadura sp. DC4]
MTEHLIEVPPLSAKAQAIADKGRWGLSSDRQTGALLRTLAASKPGGRILEIGAGVGVGSGWLLAGMDSAARLTTLELFPGLAKACASVLAADGRAEVVHTDAVDWLTAYAGPPFDLVFVDTTILKFERRDLVFAHLADGALFVADDLLPQEKWTEAHYPRVERFREEIMAEPDLVPTLVDWASGLVIASHRKSERPGP